MSAIGNLARAAALGVGALVFGAGESRALTDNCALERLGYPCEGSSGQDGAGAGNDNDGRKHQKSDNAKDAEDAKKKAKPGVATFGRVKIPPRPSRTTLERADHLQLQR